MARFAESWLRVGTFDIIRARGDRKLIRILANYVADHVYSGWDNLPAALENTLKPTQFAGGATNPVRADQIQGSGDAEENRYTRLYREICRRNAMTVAAWQSYAFTNGVLNTDNTSLLGLSLDFGPFAFLDNFDPNYTPNHDDHALRYSYKNQPSIIWWNLVRLGESLGELIGSGANVDDEAFVKEGVTEAFAPELVQRAEMIIKNVGEEYKSVFLAEYCRLMRARLGLLTETDSDFSSLFSELLDILEALELDFNHFFRRLASLQVSDLATVSQRNEKASIFFHREGMAATVSISESAARERLGTWLEKWVSRVRQDWGEERDIDREVAMKKVNPKFIPRSWVLDEVIQRVEHGGERDVLHRVIRMAEHPFEEDWGVNKEEEERWCGDVPKHCRMMQCSCSS